MVSAESRSEDRKNLRGGGAGPLAETGWNPASAGTVCSGLRGQRIIEKVDQAVMDSVCQHLVEWKAKGIPTVPVSVNLSRTYLYSEHFARECRESLQEKHLETGELQFEVTETYAARDMEQLKTAIHALHNEGFTVLLDDFGTGYSSLLSLQELEFDILKLDCEFVWESEKREQKKFWRRPLRLQNLFI